MFLDDFLWLVDYLYTCHDFNEQLSFLSPSQIRHLIPVHPRCGGFDSLPGMPSQSIWSTIRLFDVHPSIIYICFVSPTASRDLYKEPHPASNRRVYFWTFRQWYLICSFLFISIGKSALVEALATELKGIANIVTISCTDIISKVGSSASFYD